jgi:SagB-type dehydrogenase family enzyme
MWKQGRVVAVIFVLSVAVCGRLFSETAPPVPSAEKSSGTAVLPPPVLEGGMPLMEALKNRKTSRAFAAKELPLQTISNLLWAAFGVNRPDGRRTAPSAMDCREIDLYVAMKDGLYLYEPTTHGWKRVLDRDIRKECGIQEFHGIVPVDIILVADRARMTKMNEADKDHYAWCDAGFISQNIYLFCASEGLATVVCGWVDRKALEPLMGLRPDQKVILSQPVGFPEK